MSDIWSEIAAWVKAGRAGVVVTVAGVRGSCPGALGCKMLVDERGWVAGTVGGGKIEARAVEVAKEMLMAGGKTRRVVWNLQRDIGMTCGGEMELWMEGVEGACGWRVVVFGAGHVSQALVRVLLLQRCDLMVVDPREEWLGRLPEDARLEKVWVGAYEEGIGRVRAGDQVLCLTMGHATDVPVLEALAKSGLDLGYVGVIGSRAKRKVLERELEKRGVAEEWVKGLACPVGLPIGGDAPEEIALSVAAQLLGYRGGGRG